MKGSDIPGKVPAKSQRKLPLAINSQSIFDPQMDYCFVNALSYVSEGSVSHTYIPNKMHVLPSSNNTYGVVSGV